jgi:hypothetical protein
LKTLEIFPGLQVPLDILMQRIVVLGTSGAGKTSGQRSLAELVWRAHKIRFGVFDSAEDWWGLTSSSDGQSAGIPVVIFGGDHQHLPLPATGTEFARIVTKLEQPWIADVKSIRKPLRQLFVAETIDELLRINKGNPLVIFVDEADTFAPETAKSKESNRSLEAMEDLAKRGRKQGLYPIFITQRNAAISKDVTELCQVGLLYRAPGSIDQKVALTYLGNTVNAVEAKQILAELESLPDGECFVVSKAPKMTMRARVKVRQPTTFDSSATPGLGQRRREPKVLAQPDLEALRAQMAAAIEKQKAEDPATWRAAAAAKDKRIRELETSVAQLAKRPEKIETKIERVDVPVLTAKDRDVIARLAKSGEAIVSEAGALMQGLSTYEVDLRGLLTKLALSLVPSTTPVARDFESTRVRAAAAPRPVEVRERTSVRSGEPRVTEGISGPQQRILNALRFFEELGITAASKVQLALFASASPSSSSYQNNLGTLRTAGLIAYPGDARAALTDAGRAIADARNVPSTAEEMHAFVEGLVSGPQWRILRALIAAYPNAVAKDELAQRAETAGTSSSYQNNLGTLRSLGLIDYPVPGQAAALPVLFLDGAR